MARSATPRKRRKRVSAHPPKRSRFGKFILRFLLIIFVLSFVLVSTGVILYSITDPQILVEKISDALYEQYDREIEIKTVDLSLFKGVSLEGIRLSEPGGFDYGTAIEFEEGSMFYNPIALFRGQLDILKIWVGGFYTTYDKLIQTINDFSQAPETEEYQEQDGGLLSFKLRDFEVTESQFLYNGIPLNFEAQVIPKENFFKSTVDLKVFSIYGELVLKGSLDNLTLNVSSLELSRFLDANIDLTIDELKAILTLEDENNYSVEGRKLVIRLGDFRASSSSHFYGKYNGELGMVTLSDFTVNVSGSKLTVDWAEYYTSTGYLEMAASDIDADLSTFLDDSQGDISGNLELVYSRTPYLSGEINVSNFQYEMIDNANLDLTLDYNSLYANGDLETSAGDLDIDVESSDFMNATIYATIAGDSVDAKELINLLSGMTGESGDKEEETSETELPSISLTLTLNELSYDNFLFEDFSLYGSYRNSILSISSLTFDFLNGTFWAEGDLFNNVFAGSLSYSKGKLRQFTQAFLEDPKRLYGTVSLESTFRLDLSDIYDSVIEIEVSALNGEIKDFIIQDEISSVLYDIPLNDIFFDEISLSALMNNRILTLTDLDFSSDSIELSSSGTIELDGMLLNLTALLSVDESFLSGLPNVTRLFTAGFKEDGRLNFDLIIGGSMESPSVELD